MKKPWLVAAVTALALSGCKKEETVPPPPAAASPAPTVPVTPMPTKADVPVVEPPAVQVRPPVPAASTAVTPAQPAQVDRREKARAELDRMLSEWQAGEMPKEFVDAALLFTYRGVTAKLLDYKINGVIPMPPPSRNFKGTINLTVEGRPAKQVQFMLMEDDAGKWKALVGE